MLLNIIILIVGFVLLIKGADLLVESAASVAGKMHIPQIIIGLTIVAMGTSAPEAAISIQAAIKDQVGITIGNVLGSNILNILLILGLTAIFKTIHVKTDTIQKEIPFIAIATIIFTILGIRGRLISRVNGVIFLVMLAFFMYYTVYKAKKGREELLASGDEEPEEGQRSILVLFILFLVGLVMLIFGSDMIVDSASYIAKALGMSDRLIGLTIVAFGTSLPELITSLTALKKENPDMAIGNVVGSNVFNLLFIIGVVAVIHPIPFPSTFIIDSMVALFAVILLYLMTFRDKDLNRKEGIIFVICYIIYTIYLIMS